MFFWENSLFLRKSNIVCLSNFVVGGNGEVDCAGFLFPLLLQFCWLVCVFRRFRSLSTFNFAHASSTLPVGDAEYANGTLVPPHSPLTFGMIGLTFPAPKSSITRNTLRQIIPYPGPSPNIVGQHFTWQTAQKFLWQAP